jgi:hypothetical protein
MMKPSEFQTTIENQFDYICKVAMEDERKDYLKALSRQCKRETLFCDMDDYTVNLFSSEDTYPSHFHTFEMDGFTVRIENSLLAEALENLDGKKRDVILRYYFKNSGSQPFYHPEKKTRRTGIYQKIYGGRSMTAKHPMIPFPVIVRAADGDIEAVNQIVRHYSGFIASRSMRPMKDEYGNTHMVVDETLRRRMETRLIAKILSFEIREPK